MSYGDPTGAVWLLAPGGHVAVWFKGTGENAFARRGTIFTAEPNRVASVMSIECLDGFGQGTPARAGGR